MRHPIQGSPARLTNRSRALLATLVGALLFGGMAASADDRPKTKASRKAAAAKALNPPPMFNIGDPDAPETPPAFKAYWLATGDELAFQKGIAKVLCDKAESYPGREVHFNWLAGDALYRETVYHVYGLKGCILEAKELPGGGWLARVQVQPYITAAGRVDMWDFILEDYRYQKGVLTLVQTDAAVPKPDKQVFRLH